MPQQVSKPAKHHQIMATAAMNPNASMEPKKVGAVTKVGRLTSGIMVRNQMTATPQKKNMKPFCRRPVICTPRTLVTMNSRSAAQASTTSGTGSSTPTARKMVLK